MLGKRINSLKVLDKEMVFQNLSCFLDAKGSAWPLYFLNFDMLLFFDFFEVSALFSNIWVIVLWSYVELLNYSVWETVNWNPNG